MSAAPLLSLSPTRVALVQLGNTTFDKKANLASARDAVLSAVSSTPKPDMVVLPECFNSPYGVKYFSEYAEELGTAYQRIKAPLPAALPRMARGKEMVRWTVDNAAPSKAVPVDASIRQTSPTAAMLSDLAKETGIVLVGGSIPERDQLTGHLFNTSCVFDQQGQIISMHRKLHLFDIDIPGRMTFQESETLTGGDRVTVFDCSLGRFGLGICYDLRFPEPAQIAARLGAGCLIYPGAFNTTTGPVSWELLQRARATDNQVYVLGCSPARPVQAALDGTLADPTYRQGEKAYPAWGHSTITGPLGDVKAKLTEGADTLFFNLDPEEVKTTRTNIPISTQRRFDVYPDVTCG